MVAGLYNTPIDILKLSTTRNDFNEVVDTYGEAIVHTRARVVNLSNNRDSINNETFYTDTKQLIVHYYVNVDEFDHVKLDNKEYRIVSLIKDRERQEITLNIELINE